MEGADKRKTASMTAKDCESQSECAEVKYMKVSGVNCQYFTSTPRLPRGERPAVFFFISRIDV